jgi:ABC-type multidrug transport system fused ATPase/permease subunit
VFRLRTDLSFELAIQKKKIELDAASFEDPDRQDLISKTAETSGRTRNFVSRTNALLDLFFTTIIAIASLSYFYWWVSVVLLLAAVPEFFVRFRYGNSLYRIYNKYSEPRRLWGTFSGYLSSFPLAGELRIFQITDFFFQKIKTISSTVQKESLAQERKGFLLRLTSSALGAIAVFGVTLFFIIQIFKGSLSVGTFTFLLASVSRLRASAGSFFGLLGLQYEDWLYVGKFLEFLDLQPFISSPVGGVAVSSKTPAIVFDHVSFSYPGQSKVAPALSDVSFEIAPGERVAVVGINGAGKTTFTKLLCRFYDPTEGRILVDGVDLRDIDLSSWYKCLSVLFQTYGNYRLSVSETIALGDAYHKPSPLDVVQAARKAQAASFIEKYPKGFDQLLGRDFSDGIEPSGGQWQRLAIARLLYRSFFSARVLILDEPTAALDALAEEKIFETLESLPRDKTVILISHRFSTVRHADRIIVFEEGQITESGSHDELIEAGGLYASMFSSQAKGYL